MSATRAFAVTVSLVLPGVLASALAAQEATTPAAPATEAPTTEAPAAEAPVPGAGEAAIPADEPPAPAAGPSEGEQYIKETHQDWRLRCVRLPEASQGADPCEMNQVLTDAGGTQTAEINVFAVNEAEVLAGVTIVTPLNTLLTQGATFSVDGGEPGRYPFAFCNRMGCFTQFGLAQEDLGAMQRGNTGQLTIVPVADPSAQVQLTVSLAGFTAAWNAMTAAN